MVLFLNISLFILGLVFLSISSNLLIKTSVRLAYLFKLTTLFIGLIFIAFGTSLPEATVSLLAVIKKYKDIALGNIVGSNIANIGLVLGLSGLIRPLRVDSSLFKREVPIMVLSSLFLYIFSLDGLISRGEGLVFLLSFIFFFIFAYKSSKLSEKKEFTPQEFEASGAFKKLHSKALILILFFLSLTFLLIGANMMVNSGVNVAKFFGISPWLIAITIFAIGTSLPELAASLSASIKGVSSISVGNVVGSNIFNILFVLGIASLIRPIRLESSILRFELPFLIFFSIIVSLFMRIKDNISRGEAGVLFLSYLVFIWRVI